MANRFVGYYVHHHGTGHMQRALHIIKHISQPVYLFSSAEKPDELPNNVTYIRLPDDKIDDYKMPLQGVFAYTPYNKTVLHRYEVMLKAIQEYNIGSMYVDVSVEVATFCKLLGLRVGYNVMHGIRNDKSHLFCYEMADYLLADMTSAIDNDVASRNGYMPNYVGGIARYKKEVPKRVKAVHRVAVTCSPKSERSQSSDIIAVTEAMPDVTWDLVGKVEASTSIPPNVIVHGIVADPKQLYEAADVVIGSGGHNTIMEMAALGKHFVCIPEDRPYQEQVRAAKAIANLNMAMHVEAFPTSAPAMQESLNLALQTDVNAFQSIVDDGAAKRAAQLIAWPE